MNFFNNLRLAGKLLLNFKKKNDKVILKEHRIEGLPKDVVQYHLIQTDQTVTIRLKTSNNSNSSGKDICIYPFYFPLPK